MKALFASILFCCSLLLFSCKKNFQDKQPDNSNQSTQRRAPEYFKLPPNGQFVDIPFANGKSLNVYQVDSSYIIEGDIALTKNQIEILKAINANNTRAYITDFVKHWPGGVIPYNITPGIGLNGYFTIQDAMNDWMAAVPGLHFVQKINQTDYIAFVASNTNQSPVGKIGGEQHIQLIVDPTWGVDYTSAAHEIGHAIGLFHEQSRTDRDNFINIDWGNIIQTNQILVNFRTFAETGLPGANLGTFDFNSIMLYPSVITDPRFVINTTIPTMTRLDGSTWGWNFWLSAGDVETGRLLYGWPFARLSFVQVSAWDDGTGSYRDEWQYSVNLFNDEACTVPFTATDAKDVHVKIQSYRWGYDGFSHRYFPGSYWDATITVNPGQSSAIIGTYTFFETSFQGNVSDGEYFTFDMRDAFKR